MTAWVASFLRITDKFGCISYSHFFSALAIDSGRLETLEALYLLFHWTAFSLKWSQFTVSWYIVLTYLRLMIHFYTPGIDQWSICIPLENTRKPGVFWCFQGVHERNIGLHWVKQLRNVIIQLQGEHLLRHLQKRTLISKKEQDLKLARRKSKTYSL